MERHPRLVILPGIGNSGSDHWQTHWEQQQAGALRFEPADWDRPDLADWLHALDAANDAADGPVILVAHSLACLLVAHWATRPEIDNCSSHRLGQVIGAFLVAVPDPASQAFPAEVIGFGPTPLAPMPFPALVVASSDDPYAALDYSRSVARAWGAAHMNVGPLGHINGRSGLASWNEGWRLLQAFIAGL